MEIDKSKKFTFGPVPSRRLGRSLGIDIMPFKTCTYDCIYCQLGRTTVKTAARDEYTPIEDVLRDVRLAVSKYPDIDYLTVSGSGEPTLHTRIGELIDALKSEFSHPVAVLTNGSLLFDPDVAKALLKADVVMPTLAADCQEMFSYVHRPHEDLPFDKVVGGIVEFAGAFKNHLWLELFLLDGKTADENTLQSMKRIVDMIAPERIHLNTSVRPPVEEYAVPVDRKRLESIALYFGSRAEVVVEYKNTDISSQENANEGAHEAVVELLWRRPCTENDIVAALSLHRIEVIKILSHLFDSGKAEKISKSGVLYYKMKSSTVQNKP